MLYHASKISGLRELTPCRSTHGAEYVYAIKNRITAICFGASKDDFDLLMDEVDGITVLYECYPGAFQRIYAGKNCSLYEVSEEGFLEGQTGWDAELVCTSSVPVIREERINDIYSALREAVKQGLCVMNEYTEDTVYQSMLQDELAERVQMYGLTEAQMNQDTRFANYLNALLGR